MALQGGGQISINDIRNELSLTSGSLAFLSESVGFGNPHLMSEFYGYSAAPVTSYVEYAFNNFALFGTQYMYIFYNGGYVYEYNSTFQTLVELYPIPQTIYLEASDDGGGGVTIAVNVNGSFLAYYDGTFNASIGALTATAGNTYYFEVYTGVM